MKIPESVLVVIHTPQADVLLLERADHPGFWQSVTGSRASYEEPFDQTCRREVSEETGLNCDTPGFDFHNWQQSNQFEIFKHWRSRFPEGTTHNTEHVYGLTVPEKLPVQINPQEHLAWRWVAWREAVDTCFSWTNVAAIRQLPQRLGIRIDQL